MANKYKEIGVASKGTKVICVDCSYNYDTNPIIGNVTQLTNDTDNNFHNTTISVGMKGFTFFKRDFRLYQLEELDIKRIYDEQV